MALWGNNDNISAAGRVTLDYATGIVTGFTGATTGTLFGQAGSIQEGDVIRFGVSTKPGVYFGDAVVVSIASTIQLTIGSTAGLSGVAIANTTFQASQLPKYTIGDSSFSRGVGNDAPRKVYGISTDGSGASSGTQYEEGVGWVGIQTYMGAEGELRVKKEILVAMSGITTGNTPSYPNIVSAS
mgnify:FL=1|jgi:hypothetical protein